MTISGLYMVMGLRVPIRGPPKIPSFKAFVGLSR